jgi:hypothetical protein
VKRKGKRGEEENKEGRGRERGEKRGGERGRRERKIFRYPHPL